MHSISDILKPYDSFVTDWNASLYYHWKSTLALPVSVRFKNESWTIFLMIWIIKKKQSEGLVHDLDSSWLIYSSLDQNNDLIDQIDQFYYQ